MNRSASPLAALVMSGAMLLAMCPSAAQQTIELKNDSLVDGSEANICPCFARSEEAAAWLTSPCDGEIIEVRIFWASYNAITEGDFAQVAIEDAIVIRRAGTFPVPGAVMAEFFGPALQDGGLNVFTTIDDDQQIPLSVPVSANQTFVVSLRFDTPAPSNPFLLFSHPTVISDNNGCQAGRNAIYNTDTDRWEDACNIPGIGGISGDWVIRVVVDCGAEPAGACCLPDGSCTGTTQSDCASQGGVFNGPGTSCTANSCLGACFIPSNGNCAAGFSKPTCDIVGGQWQGPGTTECTPDCPVDFGSASGGGPDGMLDVFDILGFFQLYAARDSRADLGSVSSSNPTPDGNVDIFDILAFFTLYGRGC